MEPHKPIFRIFYISLKTPFAESAVAIEPDIMKNILRRRMERLSQFFLCLALISALSVPQSTYAFSWDWIAPLFNLKPMKTEGISKSVCMKENSWGKCVLLAPQKSSSLGDEGK